MSFLQELLLVCISKFCSVAMQMPKYHVNIYQSFCIRAVVLIICFVANTRFYVFKNVQRQSFSRKQQTAPRLLSAKCSSKLWLSKKWTISYQFISGVIKKALFYLERKAYENLTHYISMNP